MIAAGEQVFSLYGAALRSSLEAAGFAVFDCVYPSGEEEKTPETLMAIIESLARAGFCRADAVFALGGGVTGDMAGLAAALWAGLHTAADDASRGGRRLRGRQDCGEPVERKKSDGRILAATAGALRYRLLSIPAAGALEKWLGGDY